MKIYAGIDIAKLNHFAAAISSDGNTILEPFKFTNDALFIRINFLIHFHCKLNNIFIIPY